MKIKQLFDKFELTEYGFEWNPEWEDPNRTPESFWEFCENLSEENLHFEHMCMVLANSGKDDELFEQLFKLRESKQFERVLELLESSIKEYLDMVL
jgi:hypothetical protein